MIPYKDDNPTELPPLLTVGIILLNVLAWLFLEGAGATVPLARSVCHLGLIPGEILQSVPPGTWVPLGPGMRCIVSDHPNYLSILSSMFMHGGWLHLIGNLWFLWLFGNNIEDAMGHGRFLVFYLLCGGVAALTQVALDPRSAVPMVGASGAISGVLGGYILLYPRVRVHVLIFLGFFATTITLPAYLMLGYWVALQALGGVTALAAPDTGGVAVFAHLGGFVAGLVLIKAFARADVLARRVVVERP